MKKFLALIFIIGLSVLSYRSFSLFVMPPVEPITKGSILVMWKDEQLGFLSSPDSVCEKEFATQNPACRATIMAMAHAEKNDKILFELPYVQFVHWFA